MDTWPAVLVVDDFRTMTEIIARLLKEIGVTEVDTVQDAEAALQRLRSKRYGLVLSDWEMQPMSGPELIATMRHDPMLSNIPVILVTAKSDRDSSWLSGGDGYIVKPFTRDALQEKMKEVLSQHHAKAAAAS